MWPELSSIRIVPRSRASLRSLIEPAGMLIASLRTLIDFTRIRTQAGLAHLCEHCGSRSLSVDTWADYGTDSPRRASSMLTPLVTRPWKIQQTQRTKRNLPPVQREKRDGRDDSKTPEILYSKKTRERGSKKTV